MKIRIRVSFHCVTKAMMKAAKKVERAWMTMPSFSAMPDWISLPFVVACWEMEPETPWS